MTWQPPRKRLFWIFLALTHVLCFLHWGLIDNYLFESLRSSLALCWPGHPACEAHRGFVFSWSKQLILLGSLLSLASVLVLWKGKLRTGLILLYATWGFRLFLQFSDYRLSGNFHYMVHLSHLFLLIPASRARFPLLLATFYFCAGLLKFSPEWLSGENLLRPLPVEGEVLTALLAYVIPLEIVFSFFLLLSKKSFLYRFALANFVLFHLISFPVVGYFYPGTMFLLLGAAHFSSSRGILPAWKAHTKALQLGFVGLLLCLQAIPLLLDKKSEISGWGRLYALHMLDSFQECKILTLFENEKESWLLSPQFYGLTVRQRCDPLVSYNFAAFHCKEWLKNDREDARFYLRHFTRKSGNTGFVEAASLDGSCKDFPQLNSYTMAPMKATMNAFPTGLVEFKHPQRSSASHLKRSSSRRSWKAKKEEGWIIEEDSSGPIKAFGLDGSIIDMQESDHALWISLRQMKGRQTLIPHAQVLRLDKNNPQKLSRSASYGGLPFKMDLNSCAGIAWAEDQKILAFNHEGGIAWSKHLDHPIRQVRGDKKTLTLTLASQKEISMNCKTGAME